MPPEITMGFEKDTDGEWVWTPTDAEAEAEEAVADVVARVEACRSIEAFDAITCGICATPVSLFVHPAEPMGRLVCPRDPLHLSAVARFAGPEAWREPFLSTHWTGLTPEEHDRAVRLGTRHGGCADCGAEHAGSAHVCCACGAEREALDRS